jgi:hypothetical protein
VVAYCSSCREDRGMYTHRGSYSSSHDWLHMYDSRWRYDIDDWHPCYQNCIKVISLVQRGRDCSYDGAIDRGSIPKESSDRGSSPKERTTIDVKGGEIGTFMWRDEQ